MKDVTQKQRPGSQLSAKGNTAESQGQHSFSMLWGRKLRNVLDCMQSVFEVGVGDQGLERVIWISYPSAAA